MLCLLAASSRLLASRVAWIPRTPTLINVLVEWNPNSKHLKSFLVSSLFPMTCLGALPTLPVWWPSIVLLSYLWQLTVLREQTQALSAYSAPCLFTVLSLAGGKTFRKAWLRFLYPSLYTGLFIGTRQCTDWHAHIWVGTWTEAHE